MAWAFVLRSEDEERRFYIKAAGAQEYSFTRTHGENVRAAIHKVANDTAMVTLSKRALSPVDRVDITVVGRNKGTGWGAPSYVSFAVMDASAPYSDPALTVLQPLKGK
jgi:hypothetical protein